MFPTTVEHPYAPRGRRRGRNDPNSRDFICPCGKSYLSYPALFTHIKIKHNGRAPGQIIKPRTQTTSRRGRPRQKEIYDSESDTEDNASNCLDRLCDFVTNFEKPSNPEQQIHFKQIYTQDSFYRIFLNFNPQEHEPHYIESQDLYEETCDNTFCEVMTEVNKRLTEPYYIDVMMMFFVMLGKCINECDEERIEKYEYVPPEDNGEGAEEAARNADDVNATQHLNGRRTGSTTGQAPRAKRKYDMTNRKRKSQIVMASVTATAEQQYADYDADGPAANGARNQSKRSEDSPEKIKKEEADKENEMEEEGSAEKNHKSNSDENSEEEGALLDEAEEGDLLNEVERSQRQEYGSSANQWEHKKRLEKIQDAGPAPRIKTEPVRGIVNFINPFATHYFPKYRSEYRLEDYEIFNAVNIKKFIEHFFFWLTTKKYLPFKVRVNDGTVTPKAQNSNNNQSLQLISEESDQSESEIEQSQNYHSEDNLSDQEEQRSGQRQEKQSQNANIDQE